MVDPKPSVGGLSGSARIVRTAFLAAAVGNKHVVMNVDKGTYVGLDAVGKNIWDRLESSPTITALCDDLQTIYQVADRARFEGDVAEFIGNLRLLGLVQVML